jgi:hypothetical protein
MEKEFRLSQWAKRFGLAICFAALVLGTWAPAAKGADAVRITTAEWKPETSQLKIEGMAEHRDGIVLVRDATTKAFLGSAAVRADGKWALKIREPKSVPCRTRAEIDGQSAECDIENAPTGPTARR